MITITLIQKICVWAIPVLFAITLHEAAHAWVANRLGDSTAKMLNRLSLNPIRHIDFIGTLLVPILVAVLSQFQFIFGWAKPVPINWSQLKHPKRDMSLVAAAGPVSNLLMAIFWSCCLKMASLFHPETSIVMLFLLLTSQAGILINLVLAFLNLIPIPPLDGSRILAGFLPRAAAASFLRIEPFGFFILLGLLLSGLLGSLLTPLLEWSLELINTIFKL